MRVGAWLGLVLVSACHSGSGADLEIRSSAALSRVEVFVAATYCSMPDPQRPDSGATVPCSKYGIAWAPGQPAPAQRDDGLYDEIYVSVADEGQTVELQPTALQDGSFWRLHLEAEPDNNAVKMIIVGYDAQDQAIAVAKIDETIPLNSAEHWTITLDPASPASLDDMGKPDIDGGEPDVRVHTWGRDEASADAARCVVMQHWDGVRWQGTYIVPESDHDCDNETVECDPLYFNLNQQTVTPPNPNQVLGICASDGADLDGPCRIGISTCVDGKNGTHVCDVANTNPSAGTVCVPDAICTECPGPYGLRQCVNDAVRRDVVPHASCRFSGSTTDDSACGRGKLGSAAFMYLPYPCQAVEVRSLSNVLVASGTKAFRVNDEADFTVELDPDSSVQSCKVYVYFEAGVAHRGDTSSVILAVTPSNSITTTIIVPLEIVFEGEGVDCTQQLVPYPQCDALALETDHSRACGY